MILSKTTPTYSLSVYENDDIQEFDSKWDGILLSMTKIPHDDILEGLYKLRMRESEKLKTVLELYDLEIHQKKAGPDYHRLKTMVKRSIEQDLRNRNFGARNGNYERNAVVKNQGTKQRGQRILGDLLAMGNQRAVLQRTQLQFPSRFNKRAKMTQPNPSPNSFMPQDEKKASKTQSQRKKSQWKNFSMAMQGSPQRNVCHGKRVFTVLSYNSCFFNMATALLSSFFFGPFY